MTHATTIGVFLLWARAMRIDAPEWVTSNNHLTNACRPTGYVTETLKGDVVSHAALLGGAAPTCIDCAALCRTAREAK